MTGNRIIVSIPYTGTRFLRERLNIQQSVHTFTPWDRLLEIIEGFTVIAPLRDPKACWTSWARRWDYGYAFDQQVTTFTRSWLQMHTLTLVKKVDFICVDKQEDERIKDWSPVGNDDRGDSEHPLDVDFLYELPFVKHHYGV